MLTRHFKSPFQAKKLTSIVLLAASCLAQSAATRDLIAQSSNTANDPEYADDTRPAACPADAVWWKLTVENLIYGLVEVDGYFFDANPFRLTKWTSATSGIYTSRKEIGRQIVDRSGTRIWTDARVMATCWESGYGPLRVWWAHWERHLGEVVNKSSLASCETGSDGGAQTLQAVYDPYAPEDECDPEGGGGDGGSGIQFEPGDNTGGETVGWGTGVGNGGSSECGTAAVVEYVCIDVYLNGRWQRWDCGFATTC